MTRPTPTKTLTCRRLASYPPDAKWVFRWNNTRFFCFAEPDAYMQKQFAGNLRKITP